MLDTRELGRRPGATRTYQWTVAVADKLGLDAIRVEPGATVDLDVRLESVVEGVLVSGEVRAPLSGECSRCLDPFSSSIEVSFTELFAYPESATDDSTDEDEVGRLVDDLIDLEQVVRDAVVLTLPSAPVCSEECLGLCPDCGVKRAELGPDHRHETIDPRWAALRERFGGSEEENE